MENKAELIIMALQQRIGELVSNYETQVAILRAEITQYSQEQEEKKKAAEEYSKNLEEKTSKQKST
jgi:sRNA-binding carbon storage regulator CsrA